MKLQCYKVFCRETDGTEHVVGIMTTDSEAAKHSAVNTLLEGKHVKSTAYRVEETNSI